MELQSNLPCRNWLLAISAQSIHPLCIDRTNLLSFHAVGPLNSCCIISKHNYVCVPDDFKWLATVIKVKPCEGLCLPWMRPCFGMESLMLLGCISIYVNKIGVYSLMNGFKLHSTLKTHWHQLGHSSHPLLGRRPQSWSSCSSLRGFWCLLVPPFHPCFPGAALHPEDICSLALQLINWSVIGWFDEWIDWLVMCWNHVIAWLMQ